MSDDILSPIELGFAEFVAKLISEIFDATISSQAQQQEKIAELQNMLLQPESEFLNALLGHDDFIKEVDAILQGYFPTNSTQFDHAIIEGAPYTAETGKQKENPPIRERIGLELTKGDFLPKKNQLTQQGVFKIYQKVAEPLAFQKRAIFKNLVESGLPAIVVESGKINAKLTFNTTHIQTTETDIENISNGKTAKLSPTTNIGSASFTSPITPVNRYVGLLKPKLTDQIRLTVKQASNKSPQDSKATANIFSEVEIHFKTIT